MAGLTTVQEDGVRSERTPFTNTEVRSERTTVWFEYHCWEDHRSADAPIWYRSHQQVLNLGHVGPEGHDPCLADEIPTRQERAYEGCPCLYRVRFEDGLEWDVFEDELLDSPEEFTRPDPPRVLTP